MTDHHGFVVSDLHLMARWSTAEKHIDKLAECAKKAEFMVFNGDIFDFKWSRRESFQHSVDFAVEWLEKLIDNFPECSFYYILGNHDSHLEFVETLKQLAEAKSNFAYQPSHIILGTSLFMHGDLVLSNAGGKCFERSYYPETKIKHPWISQLYHLLISSGIHNVLPLFYRKQKTAEKIYRALPQLNLESAKNITDIYFGHTHVAFRN